MSTSLRVTGRVIYALMKREASTRNGRLRFGYIWAFLEPALYVLAFTLFRSFISSRVPFGENAAVYILTAILTFRTALGIARRTLGAINSNMALLTYPQVKTFDVIVARIALEAGTWIVTSTIFILGLYFFTGVWAAQVPEQILAGYAATLFLGASFGFFNATFVRIFPFWEKIVTLITLPMFFLSGILFLPAAVPPDLQNWLWYNPFLHVVEWVRSGVYLDYTPFLSPAYVLSVSAGLLFIGLFINKYFQSSMLDR